MTGLPELSWDICRSQKSGVFNDVKLQKNQKRSEGDMTIWLLPFCKECEQCDKPENLVTFTQPAGW